VNKDACVFYVRLVSGKSSFFFRASFALKNSLLRNTSLIVWLYRMQLAWAADYCKNLAAGSAGPMYVCTAEHINRRFLG